MAQLQTHSQRIGVTKGEILKHAMHKEVLAKSGQQKEKPKKEGEEIIYRRYLPFGATTTNINAPKVNVQEHILQEGITPEADEINYVDVYGRIDPYGAQYMYTDKLVDLHEDDIPSEYKKQIGERFGLLREMIRWGAVRTCTNRFYAGGTSRGTVSKTVTLDMLRKIARNLEVNRAMRVTSMAGTGPNFGSAPVESAYWVFGHSNITSDFRDLAGFTKSVEYANRKMSCPTEIGAVEEFVIITSPELDAYLGAGAANPSSLGLLGSNSKVDVYPLIVVAEDAWASLQLRGMSSLKVTNIAPSVVSDTDPLGQRGFVAAKMYDGAFIQNHGWMAMAEVGVSAL